MNGDADEFEGLVLLIATVISTIGIRLLFSIHLHINNMRNRSPLHDTGASCRSLRWLLSAITHLA